MIYLYYFIKDCRCCVFGILFRRLIEKCLFKYYFLQCYGCGDISFIYSKIFAMGSVRSGSVTKVGGKLVENALDDTSVTYT